MKKLNIIFWGILLLCFAFASFHVFERNKVEQTSPTVSFTVDSRNIFANKTEDIDTESLLKLLKSAGINSIALNENTLSDLESRGLINVYDGSTLKNSLWRNSIDFLPNEKRTYVYVTNKVDVNELIKTIEISKLAKVKKVSESNDLVVLELNKEYLKIHYSPIFHLKSDLQLISKYFDITLRVSNAWDKKKEVLPSYLQYLRDNATIRNVVFLGNTAPSYKNLDQRWFDYQIGMVEVFAASQKQLGTSSYVKESGYNGFRLHSLSSESLNQVSQNDLNRLVKKAIKERNIRMLYLNIPDSFEFEEKNNYTEINKIKNVVSEVNRIGFKTDSQIENFDNTNTNVWILLITKIGIVIATVMLLTKLLSEMKFINEKTNVILSISVAFIGIIFAYLTNTMDLVASAFSLLITLVAPVYLAVYLNQNMKDFKLNKVIAMFMFYLIGLSFLISLNSDLNKLLYIEGFRGVSLTLLVPILFIVVYVILKEAKLASLKSLIFKNIRYIDVLLLAVFGAIIAFYLNRSGNGGIMLPFEDLLRDGLEDALSVRPRTKEFLLAVPIVVVMLFYWNKIKFAKLLLPVFAMYIASTYNTFTHFHTPLEVSAIRTLLGLGLGVALGAILVVVIELLIKLFKKMKA